MEHEGYSESSKIVGALGTVPKVLEKVLAKIEIRRREYRPRHCWDRVDYSDEYWRPEEICCHLDSREKPPVKIVVKKLTRSESTTKKENLQIVNFTVTADYKITLKEYEKKDKYLDLARKFKKLWNMKVTIIPIVIGAFGTETKGLLKGLEDMEFDGRLETIQTTALLRKAWILRRVLETWRDFLSLKLQWKSISVSWCEKLQWRW